MLTEDLQAICTSLPGVTQDLKWGDNLCLLVKDKIFLLISLDEVPPTACFKVDEEDFDGISCREGFRQAPHFARRKWVVVDDIGRLDRKEWERFILDSYNLVISKLALKVQKELEEQKKRG